MVSLEEVGMFSDGTYEVWPSGTGYALRNCRDGRVEERAFGTAEAAKNEILRRQPSKVA